MTAPIKVKIYDVLVVSREVGLPKHCPKCAADLHEGGDLRVTYAARVEYFESINPATGELRDEDLIDHAVDDRPVLYQCGDCMTVIESGRNEEHTEWPLEDK